MDSSQPNSVNNFGKSTNIIDVPMVDDDSQSVAELEKNPSYASAEMTQMLPQNILALQGKRVFENHPVSLLQQFEKCA